MSESQNTHFDWKNGCLYFENDKANHKDIEVTIVFVGDISPTGSFQEIMKTGQASNIYGKTLQILSSADYRIFNLETVLSKKGSPIDKDGSNLSAPPETINGIMQGGFNLACLANNHILDYGTIAAQDTITLLKRHRIASVGVGKDYIEASQPVIFSIKKSKFAVFNCAEAEESAGTESSFGACDLSNNYITQNIAKIKKEVDYIIVIVHAGREYIPIPSPRICSFFQSFIDAGADIVVGHHPHVPQGVKIINKSLIAFSLGNFIFPTHENRSERHKFANMGYILKTTFGRRSLKRINLIPYKIKPGKGVRLLSINGKKRFFRQLEQLSAILKEDQLVNAYWETFCQAALNEKIFPRFIGALLNSYSQGKLWRKIKYLRILMHWLFRRGKKREKDTAIALNHLINPTHYELIVDTLKNINKRGSCNASMVKLLKEWGYRFFE